MKRYTAGIIGLGRQGAGIPEPYPVDAPRSHKEAYEMHPRFDLLWGVDEISDLQFGMPRPVDVVSVCTPAIAHWAGIDDAIRRYRARAIFCEKPLDVTVSGAEEIVSHCTETGVILAVNHQRAWEMRGEVIYAGDVLETGTHAAELANRMGWGLRYVPKGDSALHVELRGYGPGVSLKALDDIIDCLEGRSVTPKCDGIDGLEAVRRALAA